MRKKKKYLVLHCTATPEGVDVTAKDIERWHKAPPPIGRGWKQYGYTRLYPLNGTPIYLVPNNEDAYVDGWEITNGARGYNQEAEHWAYAGGLDHNGKPKDTRTDLQLNSLKRDVLEFHAKHPQVKIIGHNKISSKACPCFDVQQWLRSIGINQTL